MYLRLLVQCDEFFPTLAIEQKKSQTRHALLQTHRFLRTSTIALSRSLDSEVFLETKKKYMYNDAKGRLAGTLPPGVLEVLQTFQARSVED
jgi:hypothetical protein